MILNVFVFAFEFLIDFHIAIGFTKYIWVLLLMTFRFNFIGDWFFLEETQIPKTILWIWTIRIIFTLMGIKLFYMVQFVIIFSIDDLFLESHFIL